MDLFDDATAVRERFERLRNPTPGISPPAVDIVAPRLSPIELGAASATSRLDVPETAPFFADHFPRRPVYPASLLADALSRLGLPLAAQELDVEPGRMRVARLSEYKVRNFSPPGQRLELTAELRDVRDGTGAVAVCAAAEGKRVATGVLEYCPVSRP